eukprot:2446934-Pleurochrysis_carterae.AAC.1
MTIFADAATQISESLVGFPKVPTFQNLQCRQRSAVAEYKLPDADKSCSGVYDGSAIYTLIYP